MSFSLEGVFRGNVLKTRLNHAFEQEFGPDDSDEPRTILVDTPDGSVD